MDKNASASAIVYLLRHAHSAWARPGQRDFDRPLDERGIEDARIVGNALSKRDKLPQAVLCSTAARCRQTCDIVLSYLTNPPPVENIDALYSNDYRYYVDLLSRQTASPVMLIGHNPMMEDTARALSATARDRPGERLQKGFPTAGLAMIEFDGSLASIDEGGHLSEFLSPKRLRKLAQRVDG
ncbi:SixA phosphatase family protein [Hoeflea poritis]|uniref:Histidine phosphatase family protein n=1 Tax=Hoeflea poritis TaxID=2993659 RepID=A0ABT4VVN9_9HYPH|nr:histidine phosphatase family protein [Hoeflea poritis]MDA4848250.1 histidine phosphatase family protein [Hoeflea poritis]